MDCNATADPTRYGQTFIDPVCHEPHGHTGTHIGLHRDGTRTGFHYVTRKVGMVPAADVVEMIRAERTPEAAETLFFGWVDSMPDEGIPDSEYGPVLEAVLGVYLAALEPTDPDEWEARAEAVRELREELRFLRREPVSP